MSDKNCELWKELGIHHKTAEKLDGLKLSPDKAKEIPDAELEKNYGLSPELIAKIRTAVSDTPPVKELAKETMGKKADDDDKPKKKKTKDEDEEKPLTLAEKMAVVKKLKEKSKGMIMFGSDPEMNYGKRSSGFIALDAALSDGDGPGGFPIGKTVLIAGPPQSGKTAAAMAHVAKTMKDDPSCICIWADAEHSLDAPWAAKQGIDLTRLVIIPTDIADNMINEIEKVMDAIPVSAIVWDSIGSLVSWQEVQKKRTDEGYTKQVSADTMALTARFMSKLDRRWKPYIARHKPTLIFITHVYMVIGGYDGQEAIKGGFGIQHGAHVTLWMSRRKGDKEEKANIRMPDGRVEEIYLAYEVVIKIHKTRQSPTEGHKVAIPFVYGVGLSEMESVIDMALNLEGVLTRNSASGSYYTHASFPAILQGVDNNWINGREKAAKFIRDNPTVFEGVLESLGRVMSADDIAPPTEEAADGSGS